jgi:sirohydrochlorin cobaltochelatase
MTIALILFAHGARDPEWADPMRRVQAAIRERAPALRVELAFLEFMVPNLEECLRELIGGGATRIVVQPMFIARGGHIKRDLPELVEQLRLSWPGVEFVLNGVIGENESVIQAMASAVMDGVGP